MSTFQVEQLAAALDDLGTHAAAMETSGDDHHDDCLWCATSVLLSRVARFGAQLRQVELQELRK